MKTTSLPYCPFAKYLECQGSKCAMAVTVFNPLTDPYHEIIYCGLVNNEEIYNHGKAKVLEVLDVKKDY
jgi:hypothetical protein